MSDIIGGQISNTRVLNGTLVGQGNVGSTLTNVLAPGPIGATGATGPVGATGSTGPVGSTGATGIQGLVGGSGATGSTGPVGSTGATGIEGPVGSTGATGVQGLVGGSGATGSTGPIGSTGATGVQGPVGSTGPMPYNFLGAYDNFYDYIPGDVVYHVGSLWIRTGESNVGYAPPDPAYWTIFVSQGTTGATGIEGPVGATGATGIEGPVGATGVQGLVGGSGATGSTGPVGSTGATGIEGPVGSTGIQGATGPTGLTGGTGATGYSAYEIAVQHGFVGTEQEWLDSIVYTTRTINGHALSSDVTVVASEVPTNDSDPARPTKSITNTQAGLDLLYSHLNSGIVSGGALSVNADNTKFDISDGYGYIVDYWTTPGSPTLTRVDWSGKTALSSPYLASSVSTTVMIDVSGNIVYQTDPASRANYTQYIVLGKLLHPNKATISSVSQYQHSISGSIGNGMDLMHFLGTIASGINFTPYDSTLQLNRSAGSLLRIGGNYTKGASGLETPNITTIEAQTQTSFFYRYRDGSGGFKIETPAVNTFRPDVYDTNNSDGTLSVVQNGKYVNHRVYIFTSGNTYVVPGQTTYNSLTSAINAIATESFTVDPQLADANLRCVISCKGGVTALNSADVYITQGGLFGVLGGTAGGGSTSPGGSSYDIQYNNNGSFGGATINGIVKAGGATGAPIAATPNVDYSTPAFTIAMSIALG